MGSETGPAKLPSGVVEGLSHITLIVGDLDRSTQLLADVFDAEEVYSSGDAAFSVSRERFFIIGGLWVAIMEGASSPHRTYHHVAFKVWEEDFDGYVGRIRSLGIEVREGRSRVEGEGRFIYFYDYDNHLFELHTGTLEERLDRYKREPEP